MEGLIKKGRGRPRKIVAPVVEPEELIYSTNEPVDLSDIARAGPVCDPPAESSDPEVISLPTTNEEVYEPAEPVAPRPSESSAYLPSNQ